MDEQNEMDISYAAILATLEGLKERFKVTGSREVSITITKLEEALMWMNAHIQRN